MEGFKTHNQPPGTWSDDSSLTFCLAEALIEGYNLETTAIKFIRWRNECYWTARNNVFDIGMTTTRAISRLEKIITNNNLEDLKVDRCANSKNNGGDQHACKSPYCFLISLRLC